MSVVYLININIDRLRRDCYNITTRTMWLMKRLTKVRNRVARRPILPGIECEGITKLICETSTIAAAGKQYWNINGE